jgi:hypothetical protein|uniref:Uncharacterized protein n=1 Tax=viral metagenome TaxID=1070528 RepID=A0A6C0IMN2_9ZZZZ
MSLNDTVTKWILIDNKIQELNAELKQLRHDKNILESALTNYAKDNDMENTTVKVNNNKIKFSVTKTVEPITFKYLERNLCNIIKSEEQLQKTMEYLKDNREVKQTYSVKQVNK